MSLWVRQAQHGSVIMSTSILLIMSRKKFCLTPEGVWPSETPDWFARNRGRSDQLSRFCPHSALLGRLKAEWTLREKPLCYHGQHFTGTVQSGLCGPKQAEVFVFFQFFAILIFRSNSPQVFPRFSTGFPQISPILSTGWAKFSTGSTSASDFCELWTHATVTWASRKKGVCCKGM